MSSVNRITNGDTITVDVEQMVAKLDQAAGRLEKTLSKSQLALGMSIDGLERYVNQQGKCVEGLSRAQIKMQMWVDELGRVRTANDQYVADLNRIEQALGMYATAEGKVINAQGQFVRYTAQATKEMEAQKRAALETSEAQQRALGNFAQGLSGISNATSQFSVLLATIGGATNTMGGFRAELTAISQGLSSAFATAQSINSLVNSAKQLRDVSKTLSGMNGALASAASASGNATKGVLAFGKGCKAAALGAKALQLASGPLGIAIAAIGAGIMAWSASRQNNEVDRLSESFKELEERARKAGGSIRDIGDALKYGAFRTADPLNELKEAARELESARSEFEEKLSLVYPDRYSDRWNYTKAQNDARMEYKRGLLKEDRERGKSYEDIYNFNRGDKSVWGADIREKWDVFKNEMAEYNKLLEQYAQSAIEEQRTAEDRLNEQKQIYEELREIAKETGNKEAEETFRKQLESLDKKIAEAKEAQARAENEAVAKAQAEARRSSGIDQFLEKAPEKLALTIEAFEETKKKWSEQAEQLGLSNEQIKAAIDNYEKAVKDATRSALAKDLGVDVAEFNEAAKEATDKFVRLKQALEDEKIIDSNEYANLLSRLQTERAKELEEAAASALELEALNKIYEEECKNAETRATVEGEWERRRAIADEKFQKAKEKVTEEYENQRIAAKDRDRLNKEAEEQLAQTLKELDAAYKDRLARELGVDFDRVKTADPSKAFDEFKERQVALDAAQKSGIISQAEFNDALEQLKEGALATLPSLGELDVATKESADANKKYAQQLKEIQAALDAEIIDKARAKELREKARKAEEERQKQEKAAQLSKLGVDAFIAAGSAAESPEKQLEKKYNEMRDLYKQKLIDEDTWRKIEDSYHKQTEQLRKKREEERKRKEEEENRKKAEEKKKMRDSLGVDALMEELKSPLQKWRETMGEIAKAARKRAINSDERVALENKAADDYWKAMSSATETTEKAAAQIGKFELSKSMEAGSEALYLAQVKNSTVNYQTRIQNVTQEIAATGKESLYQAQQSNMLLQTIVDGMTNGNVGVWG